MEAHWNNEEPPLAAWEAADFRPLFFSTGELRRGPIRCVETGDPQGVSQSTPCLGAEVNVAPRPPLGGPNQTSLNHALPLGMKVNVAGTKTSRLEPTQRTALLPLNSVTGDWHVRFGWKSEM